MDHVEYVSLKRKELIGVANSMLSGDLNLAEGVRRICALRFEIDEPDNEVFLPIRAVESETDGFLLGVVRSRASAQYLKQMDAEMESYLAEAKSGVLQACRDIIREFS